ncbi:35134_t:CDS:1, partial [Racocetra persica]
LLYGDSENYEIINHNDFNNSTNDGFNNSFNNDSITALMIAS